MSFHAKNVNGVVGETLASRMMVKEINAAQTVCHSCVKDLKLSYCEMFQWAELHRESCLPPLRILPTCDNTNIGPYCKKCGRVKSNLSLKATKIQATKSRSTANRRSSCWKPWPDQHRHIKCWPWFGMSSRAGEVVLVCLKSLAQVSFSQCWLCCKSMYKRWNQ